MSNIFLVSDSHWGHAGMVNFKNDDGSWIRLWRTIEEHDDALVENWNRVVGPKDKVYHLGDVVINRKALSTLARLNGDKVLIKGNHDIFRIEEYTPFFRDIRGFGTINGYALTHVPIHPDSLSRWKMNVHGHLHSNKVMLQNNLYKKYQKDVEDKRYMCVSMEHINYTPISLDEINKEYDYRVQTGYLPKMEIK